MTGNRRADLSRTQRQGLRLSALRSALVSALLLSVAFSPGAWGQQGSASTAPPPDALELGLDEVHSRLQRALEIPADLGLDADLQSAAQAMRVRELPRMRQVMSAWLAEERQHAPTAEPLQWLKNVLLRAYNEMALWQLDSVGPEHDQRQQQAWSHPRSCDRPKAYPSYFSGLLLVWQRVPTAQRAAYWASEAELLHRWGRPRPPALPRIAPSVDEVAWRAIDDAEAGGKALDPALPPMLAWRLYGETAKADVRVDAGSLCALRLWALRTALQRGQGRLDDAEWLAHRQARLPQAALWFGVPSSPVSPDDYPELAQKLQVEGTITVNIVSDAKGRLLGTSVARRDVHVPGIRAQQPLAYDTLLDEASLARAANLPNPSLRADPSAKGPFDRQVQFVYKFK